MRLRGVLITFFVLLSMSSICIVGLLQSTWWSNYLHYSVLAAIEKATGARASLRSFTFSWRDFSATLDDLTLHGTESSADRPLLQVKTVRLRFQITSLISRGLHLSSFLADEPVLSILERPDGSTNIPALEQRVSNPASDIFRLRTGQFKITNGTLRINDNKLPLSVTGSNIDLLARYERRPARYDLRLHLHDCYFNLPGAPGTRFAVSFEGEFTREHLSIDKLLLDSGASTISVSGMVHQFLRLNADLNLTAAIQASDAARAMGFPWLKSGRLSLAGQIHYDPSIGPVLSGSAKGDDLNYKIHNVGFTGTSFTSTVFAVRDLIDLSAFRVSVLKGFASGDLKVVSLNKVLFQGSASNLDLRSLLSLFVRKSAPLSAKVSGPLTVQATVRKGLSDLQFSSDALITPRSESVQLRGHAHVSFDRQHGALIFEDANLQLPETVVTFSGKFNSSLQVTAASTNLKEVDPTLKWLGIDIPAHVSLGSAGDVAFNGMLNGDASNRQVSGTLEAHRFYFEKQFWNSVRSDFVMTATGLRLTSVSADSEVLHLHASGTASLSGWSATPASDVSLRASVRSNDLGSTLAAMLGSAQSSVGGIASASLTISGSLAKPSGWGALIIRDFRVSGENLNQIRATVSMADDQVTVTNAKVQSGPASATIDGSFRHAPGNWTKGRVHVRIDTNEFPVSTFAAVRRAFQGVTAVSEIHGVVTLDLDQNHIEPVSADGTAVFRNIALNQVPKGNLTLNAGTQSDLLTLGLAGTLEGSAISGNLRAHTTGDVPSAGELTFGKLTLDALAPLFPMPPQIHSLGGWVQGSLEINGPLRRPTQLQSRLRLDAVHLKLPEGIEIANVGPVQVDSLGGAAKLQHARFATRDAQFDVSGSLDLPSRLLDLHASGTLDAAIAQLWDRSLQASGTATVAVSLAGKLDNPLISGSAQLHNASIRIPNVANGLTAVNGAVRFTRERAVVQNVSAQTGGGSIRLNGVVSFGSGTLLYDLSAQADHVRFRYLGASVTGDASVQLTGTSQNGLVTGTVTLSRVAVEPTADLANLLAPGTGPMAVGAGQERRQAGLSLDLHIQNSPNMQVTTSLSQDVQADIDLRLRGTTSRPILLGHIVANQGDIRILGTRYSVARGIVNFVNTVRIEPVLDLDLQTETRGITVDVIVSGTLSKLSMSYRSDPPLQTRDIIALLTVGQAPSFASGTPNTQAQGEIAALQAGANTVLNQAISPASSRLSRFFGITNVKLDPLVQNISNTPQARLTLEQQVSQNITVTYITNLAQTSEQIFRFEWSLNPQYSVVAVRDDNGEFGVDIQYKKRFK